jgi:hypothetical protein
MQFGVLPDWTEIEANGVSFLDVLYTSRNAKTIASLEIRNIYVAHPVPLAFLQRKCDKHKRGGRPYRRFPGGDSGPNEAAYENERKA